MRLVHPRGLRLATVSLPAEWSGEVDMRYLMRRIVVICSVIEDNQVNATIAKLLFLESESPQSGVSLYIDSPGGSITGALAVRDTMRHVKVPVTTVCVHKAIGAAALLVAAGERGHRFANPDAEIALTALLVDERRRDTPEADRLCLTTYRAFAETTVEAKPMSSRHARPTWLSPRRRPSRSASSMP